MRGICPNCEKETELEIIRRSEEIKVRGDLLRVDVEYFKCTECGTEFRDPRAADDPLDKVYAEYRRVHGFLSPEKIREFRGQYGLTQQELSDLLGWGGATLSRYENGALQDEAHDTVLKLIMEPRNFLELIAAKPGALSEEKRSRILEMLREYTGRGQRSIASTYEDVFGSSEPDLYSGYRELNITKLFNMIVYFCKEDDVPKTKVSKLLFYADFKHYKEYTVSISGSQYAHLPFGPAPEHYEFYIAALQDEEKAIQIEERIFPNYVGEYLTAIKEPNLGSFATTELKILATVKEHFAELTASAISKLSHEEEGFKRTKNGDRISYEYAASLSI